MFGSRPVNSSAAKVKQAKSVPAGPGSVVNGGGSPAKMCKTEVVATKPVKAKTKANELGTFR
jgi:hypothetical protein